VLEEAVDPLRAGREHFDGEDGRGWEVSIVQRRDVRLEVWRLGVLQGPRNAQHDRLVDRDPAHEQGPVEELVAVPVIGHRVEVVLGEGPTPRHVVTATIVPSRQLVRRRRSMMVDSTGSAVGDEFRGCDLDVEGLTGHIRFGAVAAGVSSGGSRFIAGRVSRVNLGLPARPELVQEFVGRATRPKSAPE